MFVHPEQREGEMYICNAHEETFFRSMYKTKRLGQNAFTTDGKPIPPSRGLFPMFVNKDEFDEVQTYFPNLTKGEQQVTRRELKKQLMEGQYAGEVNVTVLQQAPYTCAAVSFVGEDGNEYDGIGFSKCKPGDVFSESAGIGRAKSHAFDMAMAKMPQPAESEADINMWHSTPPPTESKEPVLGKGTRLFDKARHVLSSVLEVYKLYGVSEPCYYRLVNGEALTRSGLLEKYDVVVPA